MKIESMFYIALGTVVPFIAKSDCYATHASTEDDTRARNRYNRWALKYKAKAVVGMDREIDRLVKEYGYDAV
jgi:hypothetical protein